MIRLLAALALVGLMAAAAIEGHIPGPVRNADRHRAGGVHDQISLSAVLASPTFAQPAAIVPDPTLTPGQARTTKVSEICVTSTSRLRHWSRERDDKIMLEYGLPAGAHPNFEADHVIPLCLGGADSDVTTGP